MSSNRFNPETGERDETPPPQNETPFVFEGDDEGPSLFEDMARAFVPIAMTPMAQDKPAGIQPGRGAWVTTEDDGQGRDIILAVHENELQALRSAVTSRNRGAVFLQYGEEL